MGRKSLCLLIMGVLLAYCVYLLVSRDFEEPWRIIWLNTYIKTIVHLVNLEFYELYVHVQPFDLEE